MAPGDERVRAQGTVAAVPWGRRRATRCSPPSPPPPLAPPTSNPLLTKGFQADVPVQKQVPEPQNRV